MKDKEAPVQHEDWERHEPEIKIKLFAHIAIDGRSVATLTTKEINGLSRSAATHDSKSSDGSYSDYYWDVELEMLAGEVSPTELYALMILHQRARRKLHQFELDLAKTRRAV